VNGTCSAGELFKVRSNSVNGLLGDRVRSVVFPVVLILVGLGVVLRLADAAGSGAETSFSDPIPLTAVGQTGGVLWTLNEQDGYIYTGIGSRLVVLDATGPNTPTLVGKSEPLGGFVYALAVSGTYAYVGDASYGLRIMDVSNPALPVEVGFFPTDIPRGIDVEGNYAYVSTHSDMSIIDISDPTMPILVGFSSSGHDVDVVGDYAYLAQPYVGLHILDVSDPTNPVKISTFPTGSENWEVEVVGDYAYFSSNGGLLRVIDVSNPNAPVQVGQSDVSGNFLDIVGDKIYFVGYNTVLNDYEVQILDISNPISPTLVGTLETSGDLDVAATDTYAYALASYGMVVGDVSSPTMAVPVGYYWSERPYNPYVVGIDD
jgi:hypothetical protein